MTQPRFGVEYTFIFKKKIADQSREAYELIAKKLQRIPLFKRAYVDGAEVWCLEVPSPVHRDRDEAEDFYHKLIHKLAPYNLTPRRIDKDTDGSLIYHSTGGGHVHVELPIDLIKRRTTISALIIMATKRPWLSWVFNEFGDNENAKILARDSHIVKYVKGTLKCSTSFNYYRCFQEIDTVTLQFMSLLGRKDKALRLSPHGKNMTMEFRFFDAPRSWQQTQDHIDFARAFVTHAGLMARDNGWPHDPAFNAKDCIEKFKNRKDVIEDFKETCEILGLEWSKYKKYMKNFDDRKAFGDLV